MSSGRENPKHVAMRKKIHKMSTFRANINSNSKVMASKSVSEGQHFTIEQIFPRQNDQIALQCAKSLRMSLQNYTKNDFSAFFKSPKNFLLAITASPAVKLRQHVDKLVLAVIALVDYESSFEIWGLACSPFFERQGFGSILVQKACQLAKKPIWCVSDAGSCSFYSKIGFIPLKSVDKTSEAFICLKKVVKKCSDFHFVYPNSRPIEAQCKMPLIAFNIALMELQGTMESIDWCLGIFDKLDKRVARKKSLFSEVDQLKFELIQIAYNYGFLPHSDFLAQVQLLEPFQKADRLINEADK